MTTDSRFFLLTACFTMYVSSAAAETAPADPVQLTLPKEFYAVPGLRTSIYFDNVILSQSPEKFTFQVDCEVGRTESRRWTVVPTEKDVGRHTVTLRVIGRNGKPLARASSVLHVVPADAGNGRKIRLLIVGDSLTHATLYPNELARLLSQPRNPAWTMLGTHRPARAADGVRHEGYGGWTWQRFASRYEPEPDGTYRKRSSPFVFREDDQPPRLDIPRYFEEQCHGEKPDYIIFLLGINDCFSAPPNDPDAIDARIDQMFQHAETLLNAFHKAAPQAEMGLCLTPPPNTREEAFEKNYQGRYHRWGWKRIQHRLVQRQIERFSRQAQDRRFVIPTELNLDTVDGYPEDNAVHPNARGYRQIGACLYAWLKYRLHDSPVP